ncbi:MAG: hypothetical protein ACI9UA_005157, partial [Pseudoalteromonas tetraodonis]
QSGERLADAGAAWKSRASPRASAIAYPDL